jgi:hypothetical protein
VINRDKYSYLRSSMVPRSVRLACDRGSYAPLVGHPMGDQKFIISNSEEFLTCIPKHGRHVKPLVPAAFAVVSTHQSALGPRGGLWPVLLVGNP